jgi:hypothetical protein
MAGCEGGGDGGGFGARGGRQDGVPDGHGPAGCTAHVGERMAGQPAAGLEIQNVLEAVADQPVLWVLATGLVTPVPDDGASP